MSTTSSIPVTKTVDIRVEQRTIVTLGIKKKGLNETFQLPSAFGGGHSKHTTMANGADMDAHLCNANFHHHNVRTPPRLLLGPKPVGVDISPLGRRPCNTSGWFNASFAAQYGVVDYDWSNNRALWSNR
jgi:hypothetical protein